MKRKTFNPFTVILLRPEYCADGSMYPDTYTAYVTATSPEGAVDAARKEACHVDDVDPADGTDYALIACFSGRLTNLVIE